MRICLFQSLYPENHILREHDDYPDPGRYLNQHTFHHRFIEKANAETQIDAAVSENFDFYMNFMWGQPEDEVSGVEATEYLESLNVPFIGLRSRILCKSKSYFYKAARARGAPRVPSDDSNAFPVIVKAARSCASQFLNPKSICFTPEERDLAILEIDRQLQPGRLRAIGKSQSADLADETSGWQNSHSTSAPSVENLPDDIIVQHFVQGVDYSVVIVEFGETPIALNPTRFNYPAGPEADNAYRFLTFDLAFHPELTESLVKCDDDPFLFDTLQKTAIEAYQANDMSGGSWGNVDIRITPEGVPVAIEVNPMPAIFLPPEHQCEDPVIRDSLPGGHRALLNIALASYFLRTNRKEKARRDFIATTYDFIAAKYNTHYLTQSTAERRLQQLMSKFEFTGSLLDLACGTGVFGRLLRHHLASTQKGVPRQRYVGVDLSQEMAHVCEKAGYDEVLVGSIQETLPAITEKFDHIVCYQAIQFVSSYEISLILSRCFQLAWRSVTIGVDEIPDAYNEHILAGPCKPMTSINHLQEIREFGVPRGWRLSLEDREFGWNSPATGVDVMTTILHFEKVDDVHCNIV